MTTSVFTELLSSYDGLRKRTWTPAVITEVFDQDKHGGAFKEISAAFQQAVANTPVQNQGAQGNVSLVPDPQKAGTVKIIAPGISQKGFLSWDAVKFSNETVGTKLGHGGSNIRKLIGIWLGPQTDEPTRHGDAAKQGFNGDTEEGGETGMIEPMEDEEGTEDEFGQNAEALAAQENVAFTEVQKENITDMYLKEGMSEDEVTERIAQIEKTINTPHKGTKIYKGLVETMGDRPDLPAEVKQEALDCVAALASISNKKTLVNLKDGTNVETLREEDLTSLELQALRITTIRGDRGEGGVYMGKSNIERQKGFTNLQNFTSDYDHSTYGTTFGKALGDSLGGLWGVRVIPTGVTAANIPNKEAYDEVASHSTRQSTSVERRGTGAKSLSNDWKGKLTEDIVELNVATLAGDKAAQAAAVEGLRKRLKAGAAFSTADLENLESVLLGDEYEGLLDFQRLEALGVPPNVHVRQAILQAAVQTEVFFSQVGITKDNVIGVFRPSQSSTQGYRSDVDIYLEPGTTVNPAFQDCLFVDDKGRLTLNISVKNYSELRGDTVLGSASLNKCYATPKPGDKTAKKAQIKADQLHGDFMQRAMDAGVMSDADVKGCRAAILHDRVARKTLETKFGNFTKPNAANIRSFLDVELNKPLSGNYETTASRVAAKAARDKHLNEIKNHLHDGRSGAQMAAVKIWQMQRMVRAQNDPQYAKSVAYNDGVFGGGTFENESIMRGSPGKMTTGTNHDVYNGVAKDCFGEGGVGNITLGASKVVDADGNNLMDTRITAKNTASGTRKLQAEVKLSDRGREKNTETVDALVKEKKSDLEEAVERALSGDPESQEQEALTGSTLYPILQQLPSKETGDIQKVGDKLIITHLPFCLKVKLNGHEFEGGFPSKGKALKALDLIRQLADEQGEKIDAKVEDYDAGRTLS